MLCFKQAYIPAWLAFLYTSIGMQCAPSSAADSDSPPRTNHWLFHSTNSASLRVTTNYYRFGGTNHVQMRAAMQEARPWKQRLSFDAQTKWDVHSTYRTQREAGQFVVKSADIRTTVVITLPWWVPGKPVPRDLVERWYQCVNGLSRHEQGHLVLAEAAGTEVKKRLLALPAFPSYQELSAAAEHTLNDTIREFRDRERKYDAVTRHGFTQGAVFPMTQAEARAQDPPTLSEGQAGSLSGPLRVPRRDTVGTQN